MCENSQNSVSSFINAGNSHFLHGFTSNLPHKGWCPKENKLYILCGDHFEEENPDISSFLSSNMVSGEKKNHSFKPKYLIVLYS